jgi:alpha-glucoside transport system permease protein
MKPFSRINRFLSRLPVNGAVILLCFLWIVPTLGLFVTSFRPREAVRTSGWWSVLAPPSLEGQQQYDTYCASCHGADGRAIANADLTDPKVMDQFARSNSLLLMLREPINGSPHLKDPQLPENARDSLDVLSTVLTYLQSLQAGVKPPQQLTLSNYVDAVVGYKGTNTYQSDCETQNAASLVKFNCTASDVLNPEGMGQAFINTVLVAVPATILPILLAAFAAYAFAWLDFKGRQWLFALLVGLQIVPLQMSLVPISNLYVSLGIQSTFLAIWLFHTGFGLPYAIYLMRSFLGSLPRDLFESIYIDGANHWMAFRRLALPLAMPAIASLGIFQFLWVWNDFLIAKIFLTSHPVLTVQITNLIDPRGSNWNILTGAAFLSFIVPMIVFFAFQRFFVRGMLAGSVKG